MNKTRDLLTSYDTWLIGRTTAVLDWLYEWFSISKRNVERFLIGAYIAASVVMCSGAVIYHMGSIVWVTAFCQSAMTIILALWHRLPESVRARRRESDTVFRLLWQIIIVFTAQPPYQHFWYSVGVVGSEVVFTMMVYVIATSCEGKRGRKRKLAWSKLKELFTWLPDPAPQGV